MNYITIGRATIMAPIKGSVFPGYGFGYSLRFENLDTNTENLCGPLRGKKDIIAAIERHSKMPGSFNIYSAGRYVGGTEV